MRKVQEIEKELKVMYCDSPTDSPERNDLLKGFWEHHVMQVLAYSKEMAKKYDADEKIVTLGALLHDIALLKDLEPHDELGAEIAKEFLLERGMGEYISEKVANIVLKHRCKKFMPESLEEKIVATADAMAHFLPNFYLGIAVVAKEDYAGIINSSVSKLERDYEGKIFFEDEKKLLQERMKDFKKWFYYRAE